MAITELSCAVCGHVTQFEQPPCLDGHPDCPEWTCVRCGEALLVDPPALGDAWDERRRAA